MVWQQVLTSTFVHAGADFGAMGSVGSLSALATCLFVAGSLPVHQTQQPRSSASQRWISTLKSTTSNEWYARDLI